MKNKNKKSVDWSCSCGKMDCYRCVEYVDGKIEVLMRDDVFIARYNRVFDDISFSDVNVAYQHAYNEEHANGVICSEFGTVLI